MYGDKMKETVSNTYSIGSLASATGVSTQTIRVWEKRGLLLSTRTSGGHRIFDESALEKAIELATASRRGREQLPPMASSDSLELASTGMRIRRERLKRGLSQQRAAAQIGISRSFLAAVERGESGVSIQTLAKMSDVFGIPMSEFANSSVGSSRVMRATERPRTVLAGGVTWEELARPGRSDMEPALLYIPINQGSGGTIVRPGESFVYVLSGSLIFVLGEHQEETRLRAGDALVIEGGTPVAWRNDGNETVTCVWVELIVGIRSRQAPV
jgi:transcriptional regulator with XRE-family HTH domain